MTYMAPNDPTRVPSDDSVSGPSGVPDRGGISVWGFPLIVAAALVIPQTFGLIRAMFEGA